MAGETKRQRYEILRAQLSTERATFIPLYKELSENILPRRSRFDIQDVNKGDRRNQKIINPAATIAARTARSGMMAGITSPARPWFRLTTPDPDLAEFGRVKEFLHTVDKRMTTVFLKSNLYNKLPTTYGDLLTFATSPISIEEDVDDIIRCEAFPVGSYMIAKDYRGRVNVFFREFRMTVRQLIEQFGEKNNKGEPDWTKFSTKIRQLFQDGQYETWVDICHVIKPNDDYKPSSPLSSHKKFVSCYYERGASTNSGGSYMAQEEDIYLRESGFDYFPILCPRWEVTGEDVYGTSCPGIEALGEVKALQLM
ncbi:MAG: phage tail protein, partial [Acidobacteria bacterium]|nr:phage tail protein [Acidobacteriota bacterium]